MSDDVTVYVLVALFLVPTCAGVLAIVARQKRKRDWAWHRLVDQAQRRTDASRGLPRAGNDAVIAFFEAAASSSIATLEDAYALGVPVDVRDGVGQTPLLVAANNDASAAVAWLLAKKANVEAFDMLGETALLKASRVGAAGVARLLLENGASTECVHIQGWTPLLAASLGGHVLVVSLLLQYGANRSATVHGRTAAVLARRGGHEQIATLLA